MAPTAYKEEDYAKSYRSGGNTSDRDKALDEMKDLVYSTVRKINLSGGLDNRVLYLKGMGLAEKAIETWDPSKARLATHVVNNLKPLYRDVYQYGPILHTPEHAMKDFQAFRKTYAAYTDEYGTDAPDVEVLSNSTGLPVAKVKEFILREKKAYGMSGDEFHAALGMSGSHRIDPEYIAAEFDNDPLKKKLWKLISRALEKDEPPPSVLTLHKNHFHNVSYYKLTTAYNEMLQTLQNYINEQII